MGVLTTAVDRWLVEVVALQRQLRVACLADRLDQLALGRFFWPNSAGVWQGTRDRLGVSESKDMPGCFLSAASWGT